MTDVARLLTASRASHKQARKLLADKKGDEAKAAFRSALNDRLDARRLDPGRTDPAWVDDAKNLHAGVRWAREEPKLLERFDLELEQYFRQQLGAAVNLDATAKRPDIIPPMRWEVVTLGEVHGHRWRITPAAVNQPSERVCLDCGQLERLMPSMPAEATQAFQASKR